MAAAPGPATAPAVVSLPGVAAPAAFQRRLVTPEGLDLRLVLATAGERASAWLLDALIMVAVLIVMSVLVLILFAALKEDGREVMGIIWLLGAFLLRNFYFALFELGERAATPGKRTMGIRVIARDGGRLTAEAVLVRNALREIEVFLPLTMLAASAAEGGSVNGAALSLGLLWSLIFLLFPLFNRDRLRVGDLVAGTWVVRAPRTRLLSDMAETARAEAPRFAFSVEQAGAYGVKELELLEDVLRRAEPRAMAAVAERIRAKIGFAQPPGETDQAFLAAYYAALRGRLEHRLLFGHRRRDKFDAA